MRGVSMRPGATQFTVIPSGPSSRESVFAQPVSPGRIVFESARFAVGSFTAAEVMQMIRPPALFRICGRQSSTRRTAGTSSSSNARSSWSALNSEARVAGGPPEFQTTMSMPPNASRVRSTSRSRSVAFVTSPRTARAPIRSAWSSSSSRRSAGPSSPKTSDSTAGRPRNR